MQNGIELPDFLTGVSVGNQSDTEYPKLVLNLQSETLSSIPSLSEGVVTASGSAQHPWVLASAPACGWPEQHLDPGATKPHKGAQSPHIVRKC